MDQNVYNTRFPVKFNGKENLIEINIILLVFFYSLRTTVSFERSESYFEEAVKP